jgi:small-conductance mechanosensitive channel
MLKLKFWRKASVNENILTVGDITLRTLNKILESFNERLPYIIASLLVLIIFWILSKATKQLFWSFSAKTKLDYRLRLLFSRLLFTTIFVIGIFAAMIVVIPNFRFGDLIAGLGFSSFIIGFATKDILNNLLSGVLILWRQPFKIGDYVFVGNNQGLVEYIGIRVTKLRKDDGDIILVPNSDMYSTALTIRGYGSERRMSLKLDVNHKTDLSKAKKILEEVIKKVPGVSQEKKLEIFITDLSTDVITITSFFWVKTDVSNPLEVFDEVVMKVKQSFESSGIEVFGSKK